MNSKTSYPHRLLLNLSDKIKLKRSYKYVASSNLIYYTWKNIKGSYKNSEFKKLAPTWKKSLNYMMDNFLYQIFKTTLNIFLKDMRQLLIILQE